MADLPDLKQENPEVEKFLLNWVSRLVSEYSIDGLRIDTVPEVPKWFWKEFSHAAGVFTMGEVFDSRMDNLKSYIGTVDTVLNYGLFDAIRLTFIGNMTMIEFREKIEQAFNVFGEDVRIPPKY